MLFSVVAALANSTSSDLITSYAPSQVAYIESTQVVCRQWKRGLTLEYFKVIKIEYIRAENFPDQTLPDL